MITKVNNFINPISNYELQKGSKTALPSQELYIFRFEMPLWRKELLKEQIISTLK